MRISQSPKLAAQGIFYDINDSRFNRIVLYSILLMMIITMIPEFIELPRPDRVKTKELPPRLTKLIIEKKKPKPPEPKPEEKKEEPEPEKKQDKKEEKKEEKKVEKEEKKPDEKQLREKAAKSGLLALADELAELRDDPMLDSLDKDNLINTPNSEAEGRRERSIIAANAAKGSGGINTRKLSRDVGSGSGAGQLASRSVTQVESPVGKLEDDAEAAIKEGRKAARTHEQIALVIDRYKSKLLAIYQRALRDDPTLRGNVVFELTISPTGQVEECTIVSSDLSNDSLERKLITRIKMINFGAKDVDTMIVTVPVDFYPQ